MINKITSEAKTETMKTNSHIHTVLQKLQYHK